MADVLKLQTLDGMLDYPSAEDPSKGTTEQQFQGYLKNHQSVMSDMVAVTLWQPSTAYVVGQVIYSPNMPANSCARVATAGTTRSAEPAWGAVGSTTSDGTAAYTMMYRTVDFATNDVAKAGTDAKTIVTPAALAAVLAAFKTQVISDGTKYSYALGATGGEAKHTITVDELAAHGHAVSTASIKGSANSIFAQNGHSTSGAFGASYDEGSAGLDGGTQWDKKSFTLSINASHSHTITDTGGNSAHENRQPYTVVNRWRRTA